MNVSDKCINTKSLTSFNKGQTQRLNKLAWDNFTSIGSVKTMAIKYFLKIISGSIQGIKAGTV